VPTDKAFKEASLADRPDYYLSKGEGLKLLLNHFVPTRLYNRDLINGQQFKTLGGKTIHVKREGENVTISDANVIESEVFVYNLGTMYYIDKVLFIAKDDFPATTEAIELGSSAAWTSELPYDVETLPSELTEERGTLPDALLEPDSDSLSEELDTVLNTSANRPEGGTEHNTDGTGLPLEYTTSYEEYVLRDDITTEIPENLKPSTGTSDSAVTVK
jgi:hypothetical protein